MKTLRHAFFLTVLALIGVVAPASQARADITIDFNQYGAIAYSPSTGAIGFACRCYSRAEAERIALLNCPRKDAKIVGWVKGGWLALAMTNDFSYGTGVTYGEGATNTAAKLRALANCPEGKDRRVVLCICSGDVPPEWFK